MNEISTPRLDKCFDNRPIERIKFYVFGVLNLDGQPFRYFAKNSGDNSAESFIALNGEICAPDWVLIEIE